MVRFDALRTGPAGHPAPCRQCGCCAYEGFCGRSNGKRVIDRFEQVFDVRASFERPFSERLLSLLVIS